MKRVYLDNAATTPMAKEVIEEMHRVMQETWGNPSSIHAAGREARTLIERARKTISGLLEVAPGEIFFTSGGTEADNTAICCAINDLGVTRIISSPIEHHAVLHSVSRQKELKNAQVEHVRILPSGQIDLDHLQELLHGRSEATLVSLMHGNNELGNVTDIYRVGEMAKEAGAFFHSDTVQTIGHLPIDVKRAKVDFLAASAHKFNGPKGVGFIYINNEVKVKPFMQGGAQERNMRGGTENLYGIVGMAKALEIAYQEMDEQGKRLRGLKQYMKERLQSEIEGVEFNGDTGAESLYTVLNVSFPPSSAADMLLFNLDIKGINASGGSACSSGSDVGSHVLAELPQKEGHVNLRFSFGKYNTKEDIDYTVDALKEIFSKAETV